ncbi:MAG: helix-turn-helix domain-containing protein [Polyangiales bacterium]
MAKSKRSAAIRALERAAGGPLTFGRMVRAIRLGDETTLETFARKLSVTRANLCDIEKSRRRVSVERAAQWAKILGYHPMQFVQLALQAQVDAAGLKLHVGVKRAP